MLVKNEMKTKFEMVRFGNIFRKLLLLHYQIFKLYLMHMMHWNEIFSIKLGNT